MCDLFEPSEVESKSSSSTTALKPYQDFYANLLKKAQGVAGAKYNPATESKVAGFAQPQTDAFSQVYANQGIASPYMQQAFNYAQQGAAPATSTVQNYMDPYLQNVVNSTQQQFDTQNQRQLADVRTQAAKQGALGGSGRQVAEALTKEAQMNAQNPVIAGLYSQGYGQALGAAQTDAARQLQASGVVSGMGGQAQQYAANDVNSLLGIGGMQQGLQQAQYDTATANAQQRAAYPYQQLQWLSGIGTGLGGAAGSQTTGTQTTPGPSMGQQLLGAAATGVGAYFGMKSSGGRVGYEGGGVVMPYSGAKSFIPEIGMSRTSGPTPSLAQASGTAPGGGMGDLISNYKQAHTALSGLGKMGESMRTSTGPSSTSGSGVAIPGFSTTVNPSGMTGWGNFLGFANGGGVGRLGYADGGDVLDLYDDGTGSYGIAGAFPESDTLFGDAWGEPSGVGELAPMPAMAPAASSGIAPAASPDQSGSQSFMSPEAGRALMQAGLGIMASRSPNLGVAIGEGGLAGMKAYQESQDSAAKQQIARERIAQSAASLQERARIAAENLKVRQEQNAGLLPYRQAQMENMQSLIAAREKNAAMRGQIMEMLSGGGEEGAPSLPALPGDESAPSLQPQSFEGSGPLPGIQFVADDQVEDERADAAPVAPLPEEPSASAPAVSAPTADLIDTPFGRMTRQKALKLGGAMLLDPQYSTAGKTLVELAQAKSDPGLAKPTVNALEEKAMNSATALARLTDIEKKFDPQWLEIPKRLEMMGASWSAKLGSQLGGKLSPEKTQDLTRYAQFRSASVNNLNTILKELSGAAVTPQEYERIQNDMPVAGTGIFDGDDPVSFQAKMQRATQTQRAAIARYNFMRSKGLNFDKNNLDRFMSLEDVPGAIDRRGAELEQQYLQQSPKADKSVIQEKVKSHLKREFGI